MSTTPDRSPVWAPRRPRFILVIADPDEKLGAELAVELGHHHVEAEVCSDTGDALLAAGSLRPDAVLVAAEQRGITAADVVRILNKRAGIPVVVGVGDNDGANAAAVLAAGATACIARPYRLPELIPILRAIRPDTIGTLDPPIRCGGLYLDPATLEVRLHGRPIPLPLREYQVLHFLMTNVDRVVTRDQIYEAAWGEPARDASNTLSVHIKRLRNRLGDDRASIIVTVRQIGYRLIPPPPLTSERAS